jgi:flagellar protein FliT
MPHESLARVYELTRTLVAALDAGDWQLAADISKERAPLLNAQIIDKAREARDASAARYSEARRRIDAAQQYRTTQRLR